MKIFNLSIMIFICRNEEGYSTIDLQMLFDVLVIIFAEVSIDNEKNVEELWRIDGVMIFIITTCILLTLLFILLYFFSFHRIVLNIVAAFLYFVHLVRFDYQFLYIPK